MSQSHGIMRRFRRRLFCEREELLLRGTLKIFYMHENRYNTLKEREQRKERNRSLKNHCQHYHSQSEGFIVFRSPAVVLRLGGVLPLLVAEVRADDVDLHERPEYSLCLPPQVIGSHHWGSRKKERQRKWREREYGGVGETERETERERARARERSREGERSMWRKCVKSEKVWARWKFRTRKYWLSLRPSNQLLVETATEENWDFISLQSHISLLQLESSQAPAFMTLSRMTFQMPLTQENVYFIANLDSFTY